MSPEITPVGVFVGGKPDQFCSVVAWSVLGFQKVVPMRRIKLLNPVQSIL